MWQKTITDQKPKTVFREDMPFGKHQVSCEKFLGNVYQIIDFHGLVSGLSMKETFQKTSVERIGSQGLR